MPVQPNGGNGGDGQPSSNAQEQQYELLGFIEILSFTASPPQVTPFEPTTLSWSVKLPASLHVPVSLVVGGQKTHGTTGSVSVAPYATTEYGLTAETAIVSRAITALTVPVDATSCRPGSIDPNIITLSLKSALEQQFQGGGGISLGSGGVGVVPGDDVISVSIPLDLSVPDWFDATMSITFDIVAELQGVPPHMSVAIEARNVNVDVSWAWYSTILSLGVTSAVAAGMDKVAQAFMTEIAQNQIAAAISDAITGQIRTLESDSQDGDPQRRAYVLTSFSLSNAGVTFSVCPLPASSAPPVHALPDEPVHVDDPSTLG